VAQFLIERGFTNVTPILGSFQAWQNAGYPVESGK
jgi:rhodanese-related sulfurtransferase